MAKKEFNNQGGGFGQEQYLPEPIGNSGRSTEAAQARQLSLRDRLILWRYERYGHSLFKEPAAVDRGNKKIRTWPRAALIGGSLAVTLTVVGPIANEVLTPDKPAAAPAVPGLVGADARANYALDQSVEVVSNQSVADFAASLVTKIQEAGPREDVSKRSPHAYFTGELTAPSELEGGNPKYNFFINAPTRDDGRPDLENLVSVGVSSSVEVAYFGRIVQNDIALMSIFPTKNPRTGEDYYTIRVVANGPQGKDEVTDYTNDPKVARTPDTYATTKPIPENDGQFPHFHTIKPLTPDRLAALIVNGNEFLKAGSERKPIGQTNLNPQ